MILFAALVLVLNATPIVLAQSAGVFTPTGNMITPRSGHTAILLMDGRVLIAGGSIYGPGEFGGGKVLASAELYDPATGRFTATGNMMTPRRTGHTATLLVDGRVLIAGGYGAGNSVISGAELYDPSTGVFTATGNMIEPRGGHTAILLATGKVLIVGGYDAQYPNVGDAELYDPDTGTFSAAGDYAAPGGCDFCAPSVLLADGRVLFPSQAFAPQLYNPATGTFSVTKPMTGDCDSAATLLMNGTVLFAGGEGDDCGRTSWAELYDPSTDSFAKTGFMGSGRVWHSLTLLPDGTVLAAGGETDRCFGHTCTFAGSVMSAEIYTPTTGTWASTGDMTAPREGHTSILLNDGTVLIAGGESYGGIGLFFGSTASAELYTPAVVTAAPVLLSMSSDGQGQGFILHGATGDFASPDNPANAGETVQIYSVGLTGGGVIPPQVTIGGRMAEILSFGNAPGWAGVNQINVRVPAGGVSGAAVPVRLIYFGRTSNEVAIAVQ